MFSSPVSRPVRLQAVRDPSVPDDYDSAEPLGAVRVVPAVHAQGQDQDAGGVRGLCGGEHEDPTPVSLRWLCFVLLVIRFVTDLFWTGLLFVVLVVVAVLAVLVLAVRWL